jgi:hypothetical protein
MKSGFEVVDLIANKRCVCRVCTVVAQSILEHAAGRLEPGIFAGLCAAENRLQTRAPPRQHCPQGLVYVVQLVPGHGTPRDFRLVCAYRHPATGFVQAGDGFSREREEPDIPGAALYSCGD